MDNNPEKKAYHQLLIDQMDRESEDSSNLVPTASVTFREQQRDYGIQREEGRHTHLLSQLSNSSSQSEFPSSVSPSLQRELLSLSSSKNPRPQRKRCFSPNETLNSRKSKNSKNSKNSRKRKKQQTSVLISPVDGTFIDTKSSMFEKTNDSFMTNSPKSRKSASRKSKRRQSHSFSGKSRNSNQRKSLSNNRNPPVVQMLISPEQVAFLNPSQLAQPQLHSCANQVQQHLPNDFFAISPITNVQLTTTNGSSSHRDAPFSFCTNQMKTITSTQRAKSNKENEQINQKVNQIEHCIQDQWKKQKNSKSRGRTGQLIVTQKFKTGGNTADNQIQICNIQERALQNEALNRKDQVNDLLKQKASLQDKLRLSEQKIQFQQTFVKEKIHSLAGQKEFLQKQLYQNIQTIRQLKVEKKQKSLDSQLQQFEILNSQKERILRLRKEIALRNAEKSEWQKQCEQIGSIMTLDQFEQMNLINLTEQFDKQRLESNQTSTDISYLRTANQSLNP